jgi:hypothetical protein
MLDVEIPANTYAVIILPAETGARVTESGKPIGSNDDVKINLTGNKTFSVTVGSGVYHFVITK